VLALLDPATTSGGRWAVAGVAVLTGGWHLGFRRLGVNSSVSGWSWPT
jgi:hypothetical protein